MRRTFLAARVVVAIAIVAALAAQLAKSISVANEDGASRTGSVVANFFSYFTVDSNSLTLVVLLWGAAVLARSPEREPRWLTLGRAAVTTYMVITGVVYNILLRGLAVEAVVGWSNEILHVVGPAYVLLDWLLAPGRNGLRPRDAVAVMAFPLIWVTYTLTRGPVATDPFEGTDYWYPYPFLNPVTSTGGYGSVAAYVVGITVVFVLVALLLVRMTRRAAVVETTAPTR